MIQVEDITIFDLLRSVLLCFSPAVLLGGLIVLFPTPKTYDELENKLGREIGGVRKRTIPFLETNINAFHRWLLKIRKVIGSICIIYFLLVLFLLIAQYI
jgi:hypothetical protein